MTSTQTSDRDSVRNPGNVREGDVIRSRCVTIGTEHTGRVIEVVPWQPFSGMGGDRFRIVTDERTAVHGLREVTVESHPTVIERAPDAVIVDRDGVEFHAADYWGTRVSGYLAGVLGAGAIRYRRSFRITFPQYSKPAEIGAVARAALRPWERQVGHTGAHWGDRDAIVQTELIFPSSSWCIECGHDVRPDSCGRTDPYAVTISPAGTFRSHTVRNYSHQEAHELAAREHAAGNGATVGIDACG